MTISVIQMFAPTQLSTAAATLYIVAGSGTAVLARGRIRFTNTSTLAGTVTAYDIPNGGTATPATAYNFCPGLAISAGANLDLDVPAIAVGGTIQAFSSLGTAVIAHSLDGVIFSS